MKVAHELEDVLWNRWGKMLEERGPDIDGESRIQEKK